MKKLILLILTISFLNSAFSQITSIEFKIGTGYTIVNIEEAIGWSNLEEWDHTAMMIKFAAGYHLNEKFSLIGEVGTNRLYYWEYRYSDGFYSSYRWRSEWTTNFNVLIKAGLSERLYLQGGAGLHIFNDGSGVVPGLITELGIQIFEKTNISVPLIFRIESVFGNSTPTSVMVGTGVIYNLK